MKKLLSLVKLALRFMVDGVLTLVFCAAWIVVGNLVAGIYFAIKHHDIAEIPNTYVAICKVQLNGVKNGLENYKGDLLSILES